MSGPGRLDSIWIKRAKRGPMDPADRARAVAGRGLEGNANQGGRRQVTLLSAERWAEMEAEYGSAVPHVVRRANLLVEGVPITGIRNRVLRVGPVRLRVLGETTPCERMNEGHPGLRPVMARDWRAGSFAEVLEGGEIAVGDPVAWEE